MASSRLTVRRLLDKLRELFPPTQRASSASRARREARIAEAFGDAVDAAFWAALVPAFVGRRAVYLHDALDRAIGRSSPSAIETAPAFVALAADLVGGGGARTVRIAHLSRDRLVYSLHERSDRKAVVRVVDRHVAGTQRALRTNRGPRYDDVVSLIVLGDAISYVARRGERWRVVTRAVESEARGSVRRAVTTSPWFDRLEAMVVHRDALVHLVRRGKKRAVLRGTTRSPWFDRVRMPSWGGVFAEIAPEAFYNVVEGPLVFAGTTGAARSRRRVDVYSDFAKTATYDAVGPIAYAGGTVPLYRARRDRAWCVVEGGREGPPFDAIGEGRLDPKPAKYSARRGREWFVVRAGKMHGPYEEKPSLGTWRPKRA